MFRIYDKKDKKWIRHDIFLTQNGDLAVIKSRILTGKKIKLLSSQRYQYHMDIGLRDKLNHLIHEGDICKIDNGQIGLIIYFAEIASFVFVDYSNNKYYPLSKKLCNSKIQIVGNCFDNAYLIPQLNKENETELSEGKTDGKESDR